MSVVICSKFVTREINSGWLTVESDVLIDFDLEDTPLEIKTDSALGSNENVIINFIIDSGERIGGIQLHFKTSPQYMIGRCSKISDFPTTLPSESTKIWRITLKKNLSEIRITIHCNDEEVLNVVLSDTVCNNPEFADGKWRMYWEKDVIKKVKFQHSAADYYRAYTPPPGTLFVHDQLLRPYIPLGVMAKFGVIFLVLFTIFILFSTGNPTPSYAILNLKL